MKLPTYFGKYGGVFVPEMLMPTLIDLEENFIKYKTDKKFNEELDKLLKNYAGRPTPLFHAKNMSKQYNCNLYFKREDLLHTGAHKINNTLGQCLLAKYMGKSRVIAETGAGQHGVATAAAAAQLGLNATIFMGAKDIKRQKSNVSRMKLFGATVVEATSGSKTLKDAVNEALRYYLENNDDCLYIIGSVVGPHPYPTIVQHFQRHIGEEVKQQLPNPDVLIACIGGGSNAIGFYSSFVNSKTKLIGVEAAGNESGHAQSLNKGEPGIFQGMLSYLLQDDNGQVCEAHSISAGLDYPGIGPQHSHFFDTGQVKYSSCTDKQALDALQVLAKEEGILCALESAHAIGYFLENYGKFTNKTVVINLSGRGDKDLDIIGGHFNESKE